VAQVKKNEIRQAILDAAYQLFAERGYSRTSISQIANRVGISSANLYIYFPSKLAVLFSIYEPWLMRHLDSLERSLTRISDPAQRLRKILIALWRKIPAADNGFANNMMQAFSTTTIRQGYSPTLRLAVERRIAKLLQDCLPELGESQVRNLANIALMAFDGYVLNFHLNEKTTCPLNLVDSFAKVVLTDGQARRAFGKTNFRKSPIKTYRRPKSDAIGFFRKSSSSQSRSPSKSHPLARTP